MPALPAKLSLHFSCKQQFLWQFSVVLVVVVQNWIKSTCNSCLWHVQSSISLASFLVCCGGSAEICNAKHAKTLSLHKYKTQVQQLQLQPQQQQLRTPLCGMKLTPILAWLCVPVLWGLSWKFFKWCQITRCGHFLLIPFLLLLVQAGFSIWSQLETRFWRFLFAVFGSMANVCLGSFYFIFC